MRLCLRFPFSLPAVVNVSRGFSFPPRISDAPKEKRAEGKERPLPLPVYYMFAPFQRLFESSLFCDTVHSHFPLCGVGVGVGGGTSNQGIHSFIFHPSSVEVELGYRYFRRRRNTRGECPSSTESDPLRRRSHKELEKKRGD